MPPEAEDAQNLNLGLSPLARAELLLTVFVTGGVVLTIEILGTRIVGPVFGVDRSFETFGHSETAGPAIVRTHPRFLRIRRLSRVLGSHQHSLRERRVRAHPPVLSGIGTVAEAHFEAMNHLLPIELWIHND